MNFLVISWLLVISRPWSQKLSLARRKKGQYVLTGLTTCCLRKIPSSIRRKSEVFKPPPWYDSATEDISATFSTLVSMQGFFLCLSWMICSLVIEGVAQSVFLFKLACNRNLHALKLYFEFWDMWISPKLFLDPIKRFELIWSWFPERSAKFYSVLSHYSLLI